MSEIKKILKIAIIGTNGLPGRYGGWDQLLHHLTLNLNNKYKFTVYTSSYDAVDGLKYYNGAKLSIIPLRANGWQSVPYDIISMLHALITGHKTFLILGTSGCIFFPFLKIFKIQLILNPDGAEWKRGKWNYFIKKFLKLSESIGLKYANKIIADNLIIKNYIFDRTAKDSYLIEYGGDNAKFVPLNEVTEIKYGIKRQEYAFKVCRIVPENNIDLILEAFIKIDFKLILIGNWKFSDYGKSIYNNYNKFPNIILLDPIYDQKTLDELRSNCKFYVHGHSVGGTNPSLVEAMNLSLCCIVYDIDYNRVTTNDSAIYFSSVKELINKIEFLLSNKIIADEVSRNLYLIAIDRYSWKNIIDKYDKVFLD